jgi:hypothetical protein
VPPTPAQHSDSDVLAADSYMTATGAKDRERLRTIDPSETAALYTRRTAANRYEQPFGGFLNRVSEVRVLPGAPYPVVGEGVSH